MLLAEVGARAESFHKIVEVVGDASRFSHSHSHSRNSSDDCENEVSKRTQRTNSSSSQVSECSLAEARLRGPEVHAKIARNKNTEVSSCVGATQVEGAHEVLRSL